MKPEVAPAPDQATPPEELAPARGARALPALLLVCAALLLSTEPGDTTAATLHSAASRNVLVDELRILLLGDSNDRYLFDGFCSRHERMKVRERPEARVCLDASTNTKVAVVDFTAFKLLSYAFDGSNSSESIDAALNAFFSSVARAVPALLGGPPGAILMQSLFHDLEYTFWMSPELIHGMAVSDDMWHEWLARWSEVAAASVTSANETLGRPPWIGWRTSNRVWQGDHDGWLLLAPRIPEANAKATEVAQRLGIHLVDFARFSRLEDLTDYVHPKRAVHQAFVMELVKNLSTEVHHRQQEQIY
jgi:hypothetical protein